MVARRPLEDHHVRLERRKTLLHHLPPRRHDVVEAPHRRETHQFRLLEAVGGAVRPIEADPLAERAAQEFVDRDAERPGLQIDQGVLDRADRLLVEATGGHPTHGMEQRDVRLDRTWVFTDDRRGQLLDHAGDAEATEALVVFPPADEPLIGRDFQEIESAVPAIGVQRLDRGDLHRAFPLSARSSDRRSNDSSTPPARARAITF
jgi:hypothetical protein